MRHGDRGKALTQPVYTRLANREHSAGCRDRLLSLSTTGDQREFHREQTWVFRCKCPLDTRTGEISPVHAYCLNTLPAELRGRRGEERQGPWPGSLKGLAAAIAP